MTTHLITSTAVLLVAMAAARWLPLTGRTRYAVLLLGMAKFALPDALVIALLQLAGIDLTRLGRTTAQVSARILGGSDAVAPTVAPNTDWLLVIWLVIATVIFTRWLVRRHRTVHAALTTATPASARETESLLRIRKALRLPSTLTITRAAIAQAPAVIRVRKPMVILPAAGCDDLDDVELHALLLHEGAHVAQHDNLLAVIEALAGALLWFHPLVHIALRQLAAAREQSCDEVAIEGTDARSYTDALMKICRAAVATGAAGVSCMAAAHIRERMEHLMNYETIRSRALSHRITIWTIVVLAAVAAPVVTTFATETMAPSKQLYSLKFAVREAGGQQHLDFTVIDNADGRIVSRNDLIVTGGGAPEVVINDGRREVKVRASIRPKGEPMVFLEASENGELVQRNLYTLAPKAPRAAASSEFSGEPISINLKDADLRDVMRTFSQLTGLNIALAPGVTGRVTVDFRDIPWDQALDIIAKQNGLAMKIEGSNILVTKNK
jgi:beta-lactamase regulating signal transducer with metallopeptidase domain